MAPRMKYERPVGDYPKDSRICPDCKVVIKSRSMGKHRKQNCQFGKEVGPISCPALAESATEIQAEPYKINPTLTKQTIEGSNDHSYPQTIKLPTSQAPERKVKSRVLQTQFTNTPFKKVITSNTNIKKNLGMRWSPVPQTNHGQAPDQEKSDTNTLTPNDNPIKNKTQKLIDMDPKHQSDDMNFASQGSYVIEWENTPPEEIKCNPISSGASPACMAILNKAKGMHKMQMKAQQSVKKTKRKQTTPKGQPKSWRYPFCSKPTLKTSLKPNQSKRNKTTRKQPPTPAMVQNTLNVKKGPFIHARRTYKESSGMESST